MCWLAKPSLKCNEVTCLILNVIYQSVGFLIDHRGFRHQFVGNIVSTHTICNAQLGCVQPHYKFSIPRGESKDGPMADLISTGRTRDYKRINALRTGGYNEMTTQD